MPRGRMNFINKSSVRKGPAQSSSIGEWLRLLNLGVSVAWLTAEHDRRSDGCLITPAWLGLWLCLDSFIISAYKRSDQIANKRKGNPRDFVYLVENRGIEYGQIQGIAEKASRAAYLTIKNILWRAMFAIVHYCLRGTRKPEKQICCPSSHEAQC